MLKIVFFVLAISFSWYLVDEVYGKQSAASSTQLANSGTFDKNTAAVIPELTKERIELLRRIAAKGQADSAKTISEISANPKTDLLINEAAPHALKAELAARPRLTKERIELLRSIAGLPNEDELPPISSSHQTNGTNSLITSSKIVAAPELVSVLQSRSTNSDWGSHLATDKADGSKQGFAFSGRTSLSPSLNWPDEKKPAEQHKDGKIQAALMASCNDKGEKSLYVKMLTAYPLVETDKSVTTVEGLVGWDSSVPYAAAFTTDAEMNTLRLQFGLEDTLSMLKDGKKVTLQLPWNQNDLQATFEFSLNGSTAALETVFGYCDQ